MKKYDFLCSLYDMIYKLKHSIRNLYKMVFIVAQTTAFFEDAAQMGIPNATRIQFQVEGIDAVSDLSEFDSEDLKQIADNLRRLSGCVPVDPANPNGPTIPTPPFEFGAKGISTASFLKLTTVGRP